jgi:hypothetical protein
MCTLNSIKVFHGHIGPHDNSFAGIELLFVLLSSDIQGV